MVSKSSFWDLSWRKNRVKGLCHEMNIFLEDLSLHFSTFCISVWVLLDDKNVWLAVLWRKSEKFLLASMRTLLILLKSSRTRRACCGFQGNSFKSHVWDLKVSGFLVFNEGWTVDAVENRPMAEKFIMRGLLDSIFGILSSIHRSKLTVFTETLTKNS